MMYSALNVVKLMNSLWIMTNRNCMRLEGPSLCFQEQEYQSGSISKAVDIQVLSGFVINSLPNFFVFLLHLSWVTAGIFSLNPMCQSMENF